MSPQQADGFFYQRDMKIREKGKFFVNRSVPENFQWENFLGQVPTESLRTQDSENVYERWVQQIFDPVLPARSWEMPVERKKCHDNANYVLTSNIFFTDKTRF